MSMRTPLFFTLRLRTLITAFALAFLALAWWLARPAFVALVLSPTELVSGRHIIIDPGHGGADPGAVGGTGLLEKEVTLAVAKELAPMLSRVALHATLVRTDDVDLSSAGGSGSRKSQDLRERVTLANDARADLYISIHANSIPSPKWSGAQTFYYPGKEEDRRLAEAIQARFREAFPENRRLARPGEYYVLKETSMPAVVVEVGFLSNPDEERLLKDAGHRRKVAEAIFWGIVDYLVTKGEEEETEPVIATGESFAPHDPWVVPAAAPVLPGTYALYFRADDSNKPTLASLTRTAPPEWGRLTLSDRIEQALKQLIAGPTQSGLLPTLPPETKVLDVTVEDGRAIVDLSREVRGFFWGGGESEAMMVESLVRTVGQFAEVNEVLLTVENEVGSILAGHVDIGRPFLIHRE